MLEIREQTVGGLYGECGFPHPACACQSHDPICGDEVTHPLHGHRSADQFADDHRQVAGSALRSLVAWFGSGRRLAHPVVPDGPTPEQSIARTRCRLQVAPIRAKRLTDRGYMNVKRIFSDDGARPDTFHQIIFCDELDHPRGPGPRRSRMRAARGRQVCRATEAHAGRGLSPRVPMHRPDLALIRALRVGSPFRTLRKLQITPKEPSGPTRLERRTDALSSVFRSYGTIPEDGHGFHLGGVPTPRRQGQLARFHELCKRTKPMTTVTTKDGVQIFYKDWGPKSAQPIVFHHGWPLSSDDWDTQMLYFVSKGYRVIAHDRRGHGRSTQVSDGHDMDHYAADASAVFEHPDLKNAVHIGHSTGGGEVTRYVARYGGNGRVAKAALIGAVPPLMLKTEANPGGLPIDVFDGLRQQLAANRSRFYTDLAGGPFYGFNR